LSEDESKNIPQSVFHSGLQSDPQSITYPDKEKNIVIKAKPRSKPKLKEGKNDDKKDDKKEEKKRHPKVEGSSKALIVKQQENDIASTFEMAASSEGTLK
jgi:hypothetical protein